MVVNPKHTQKVNDFIDDDKSVKKFFEILKKNKTSNTINIEKSLMEVGLPNTTLTILRDSIKGYQDVTKLNPNFLTPTLEIILKKQLSSFKNMRRLFYLQLTSQDQLSHVFFIMKMIGIKCLITP